MWSYIVRRLLYNVPVYLGIILVLMLALRVNDPVWARLGKSASPEAYQAFKEQMGLAEPFWRQYLTFLGKVFAFDLSDESWEHTGVSVGGLLRVSFPPTLAITVPALLLTSLISISVGLVSSFFRGRWLDRALMFAAVLGMSVSFLVYIVFGQYWGAYALNEHIEGELFAVAGYEPGPGNWVTYCMLPVLISTIVAMGYDTRFYRAVMVEECGRDYIVTAMAKGAPKRKIMFVHMLKNAMIPIITRIMITLPFLIMGSFLLEMYFNIPGMGRMLLQAITTADFPVTQGFVAVFALVFILTNVLTDVLYALVDPRVRLA